VVCLVVVGGTFFWGGGTACGGGGAVLFSRFFPPAPGPAELFGLSSRHNNQVSVVAEPGRRHHSWPAGGPTQNEGSLAPQFQPPAIVDLEKLAKKWAKK